MMRNGYYPSKFWRGGSYAWADVSGVSPGPWQLRLSAPPNAPGSYDITMGDNTKIKVVDIQGVEARNSQEGRTTSIKCVAKGLTTQERQDLTKKLHYLADLGTPGRFFGRQYEVRLETNLADRGKQYAFGTLELTAPLKAGRSEHNVHDFELTLVSSHHHMLDGEALLFTDAVGPGGIREVDVDVSSFTTRKHWVALMEIDTAHASYTPQGEARLDLSSSGLLYPGLTSGTVSTTLPPVAANSPRPLYVVFDQLSRRVYTTYQATGDAHNSWWTQSRPLVFKDFGEAIEVNEGFSGSITFSNVSTQLSVTALSVMMR